jgi:broad specificity phosphatase PhoE
MHNWMTRPSFYVVRHGNTALNDSNPPKYRGWQDVELNEDGLQAAAEVADYLSYERLGLIATSDLIRATKTAEYFLSMSNSPYLDINPNLRPLDVGSFTGLPKTARNKKALQHYIDNPDELIPGSSETVTQFRTRNSDAFRNYAVRSFSSPEPLVVVCHTSNITCLYDEVKPDHGLKYEDQDLVGPGGLIAVYVMGDRYEMEPLLKTEGSSEGTPTAS